VYWTRQILQLVVGFLGLAIVRKLNRSRWCRIKDYHLDIIIGIILVGSVWVTYKADQQEQARNHWTLLTPAQVKMFRSVLHNKPLGELQIYWLAGGDKPDRKNFAEQLATLLQAEHWTAQAWAIDDSTFPGGIAGLDHGTGHLASMNSQKNQRINDGTG
jgi:hypothetical protein